MKTCLFTVLSLLSLSLFGQETVIKNVNILNVKTGQILSNHSVVISNEKMVWIGADKDLKSRQDTKIIDGNGKYLMPGLIDAHIHFFQSGSIYTRPDGFDFTSLVPYKLEREKGFENAEDYLSRYLRLGITTVMDVGGPFNNFIIRDSISKTGTFPNVLVTGPLFSIVESKELELNDPPIVKIETTKDIDTLFEKMISKKPDFIKVWYIADKEHPAEVSFPLIQYLAKRCAKNNLKLAVHATELKTANLAVDAGANILVHSISDEIVSDELIKKLKEKNITYIPTMIVSGNYLKTISGKLSHHSQDLKWANADAYGSLSDIEGMDSSVIPPYVKRLRKIDISKYLSDSIEKANLMKLNRAGVNIATGTDAGNIGTFHASSYIQELEAMEKAGLAIKDLIQSSTINAATGYGISDKIGSIEKGKYADLLLLAKNPLESLQNLNSIELVFKNGKPIAVDTIVQETPEAIVQRQVNAYNAKNLDAFLDTYSKDVEIYFNDKLSFKGLEQMRKQYSFLNKTTDLYCQIENRIVINNKVIDKEKVRFGKQIIKAVAIYEVKNGKINKVTFVD